MKITKTIIGFLCGVSSFASAQADSMSEARMQMMTLDENWNRGSVHDPSITVYNDGGNTTYYVFGSHMGVAKTTDLKNWTGVTSESTTSTLFANTSGQVVAYSSAFSTNQVTSVVNYAGQIVNWGNFDAAAWNTALDNFTVSGNMWAPDIIYNTSMKKWCMYLSLNGNKWNSSIVLLTSDAIEGPYVYQGPVIFSGFNVTTNSATDYTKTDMQIALGSLSSLPARYDVGDKWGTYWPHAIDPGVFYDENGELWMNYGSWSGGIYILKLDKNTGLRDYTYTYSSDYDSKGASVTTDPYFGKKIAGGYYVSGEGSYIEHIGDYYYLFMSYGFYSPEGGYEMRIFRSNSPDGPYVDANGVDAKYTKYLMNYGTKAGTTMGEKLMGGYQWDGMSVAEIAQGHNSAFTDDDDHSFVVYHTKFNDGTAGHQLRVHQLFVNDNGWITAAPFEYNGQMDVAKNSEVKTKQFFTANQLAGKYKMIAHKYNVDYANYEYSKPVDIELFADGTYKCDSYSGSWSLTSGTSYVKLLLGDYEVHAVAVPGTEDQTNIPIVAITGVDSKASSGMCFWMYKLTDEGKIAKDLLEIQNRISDGDDVYSDLNLASVGSNGSAISWSSSVPSVISSTGAVASPAEDTNVELTAQMSYGEYSYTATFNVNVKAGGFSSADIASGLVAYYNFDNNLVNQYNASQVATAKAQSAGTAPAFETSETRGSTVLHQYFGYNDASSISYTMIENPLKNQTLQGATVSAWIYRMDTDAWDALWSFFSGSESDITGRLYLTGNTYIGYNSNGWFDYNHPGSVTTDIIPSAKWALVTISFDSDGFDIYIDGKLVANESNYQAYGSGGFSGYQSVLNLMSTAENFALGYGSFWGSTAALFDDLLIYNRALTAADVARLYLAESTGESLLPNEIVTTPDTAKIVKHGAGSSSQTVAKDSAIDDFYFSFENASSVIVTGLPEGISAVVDNDAATVSFSGVATADAGEYVYTVTTTGVNVNVSRTGTITVTEEKTGVSELKNIIGLSSVSYCSEQISIKLEESDFSEYEAAIYSATGIMVDSFRFTAISGGCVINRSFNSGSGVYIVVLKNKKGLVCNRIIVE